MVARHDKHLIHRAAETQLFLVKVRIFCPPPHDRNQMVTPAIIYKTLKDTKLIEFTSTFSDMYSLLLHIKSNIIIKHITTFT